MTDVGFEPTPPKRLVPKTSALDHSANQSEMLNKNFGIKYTSAKTWESEEAKKVFESIVGRVV